MHHSNPNYLSYYLSGNGFENVNFKILKKINLKTCFGKSELAIIGSSHYFKLEGFFFELLTCTEEKPKNESFICCKQAYPNFNYKHNFIFFDYHFFTKTTNFSDKKLFFDFEKSLLNNDKNLFHAFCNNSAITALNFENNKDNFILKTWHTYPEYKSVIYSKTKLLKTK